MQTYEAKIVTERDEHMLQLENRFEDEIRVAIYPKGIVERLRILFCTSILVNIDLTTSSNTGFVESQEKLRTRRIKLLP